jgi:hypothetical protein
MINLHEAFTKIEAENKEFGHVASKTEIANDMWVNYLSPSDRLEIMNSINLEGLSTLEKLRKCVKSLSTMF